MGKSLKYWSNTKAGSSVNYNSYYNCFFTPEDKKSKYNINDIVKIGIYTDLSGLIRRYYVARISEIMHSDNEWYGTRYVLLPLYIIKTEINERASKELVDALLSMDNEGTLLGRPLTVHERTIFGLIETQLDIF